MATPATLLPDHTLSTCSIEAISTHLTPSLSPTTLKPLPDSRLCGKTGRENCDRDLLDLCGSVSPSPSTASTSTSSLFFGPASSVNSLNSSYTSETDVKSTSDLDFSAGGGGHAAAAALVRAGSPVSTASVPPTTRSSLRNPRMGQSNQAKSPKSTDPLSRTRLKEFNQPTEGFPCRVRLLDGEEHGLPAQLRNSYTAFALSGFEGINNVIHAPPNRTVDHSVCENYDRDHRCLGDGAHCVPCPPPYGSHLGDAFCNSKKDGTSSKTGKFKEVMKSIFLAPLSLSRRPHCRSESDKAAKARSSSCSNDTSVRSPFSSTNSTSAPVAVSAPRQTSPPARLVTSSASARTGAPWSAQFAGALPRYEDVVMKDGKVKRN